MNDTNFNERNTNIERMGKILILTFTELRVKLNSDFPHT